MYHIYIYVYVVQIHIYVDRHLCKFPQPVQVSGLSLLLLLCHSVPYIVRYIQVVNILQLYKACGILRFTGNVRVITVRVPPSLLCVQLLLFRTCPIQCRFSSLLEYMFSTNSSNIFKNVT